MATRPIVTSQPALACDMCGRHLLRGERPEIFRAGVESRMVCELCAPRAVHEGWMREADAADLLSMRPTRRARRGVSLLSRLRQLREPGPHDAVGEAERAYEPDLSDEALDDLLHESERAQEPAIQSCSYEQPPSGGPEIARVVEAFNAGEHPRRMAGVARSLGDPTVTVRPVEGFARRYTIVVAWELCWYRYEVDLDDQAGGACLLEKGMELDELPSDDRAANAAIDERGELVLR